MMSTFIISFFFIMQILPAYWSQIHKKNEMQITYNLIAQG